MADDIQKGSESSEQPTTTVEETSQGVSTPENTQPNTQQIDIAIPEKFKDKTQEEIVKAYLEAEKKIQNSGTELSKYKTELTNWEKLGQIIESDPTLLKLVTEKAYEYSGKKPPTTVNAQGSTRDDTRLATENMIVSRFEEQNGINRLDNEKRTELYKKIGNELADILDPGGTKPVAELMNSIPLNKLESYLGKAYQLATANDVEERARVKALAEARANSDAIFSSMPSTGVRGNVTSLTPEEKAVAKKMGITEEQYLKQKQTLNES